MNRNTGLWGAIAIGLIGVFGFSVRPAANKSSPEAGPAQTSPAQNSGEIVEPSQQNLQAACRQINNRIAEFIPNKTSPPDSCREDPAKSAGTLRGTEFLRVPEVKYIIATLPDPVHTHFPMLFDRLTEALQQAAQDQGYNYDGSWLPWTEEGSTGEQKADTLRNRQPGVIVFRGAIPPSSEWPRCLKHPEKLCVPAPYDRGLIVFVVGENPTGGIHLSQFKNAVDWVKALSQGNWGEVRILGPYFSGSFPSLAQALLANRLIKGSEPPIEPQGTAQSSGENRGEQEAKEPPAKVQNAKPAASSTVAASTASADVMKPGPEPKSLAIFSGSVSSKAGIDWFTTFLKPARFYSFQENDDVMIDRFCQYLTGQGYDTGKLAIISENETAYGVFPPTVPAGSIELALQSGPAVSAPWLPDCDLPAEHESAAHGPLYLLLQRIQLAFQVAEQKSAAHGPLYLYYPRDIAALRSAYEQQPSGGGSPASGTGMGLPLDLAEPSSRQRDTIRSFGGKQTPLSQEATLFGITNLFKAHDIQFIVLRSSNSLDQVFLTRFLTRAYPQARVILTSADQLFRRSSETAGFRGTLTLTTYPLLTWQQDWTYWQEPESRHSHRAFPEDFAEGLYLATRFLIDGAALDGNENPPVCRPNTSVNKNAPLCLPNTSVVIQDYAPPYWLLPDTKASNDTTASPHTLTRPPTWVSVIGNEQLWPVAVLDDSTIDRQKGNKNNAHTLCGAGEPVGSSTLPCVATGAKHHPADLPLPLATFVLGAVILIWCCWHFFCCVFGAHDSLIRLGWISVSIPSSRSLAYFAPVSRPQHKVLIFIGCTIMGLMAILIASLTGVFSGSLPPLEHPWRDIFYCAGLFLLSWAALVSNYRTVLPGWWRTSPPPIEGGLSNKGPRSGLAYKINKLTNKIKKTKDKIKNKVNANTRRKIPGGMRTKLKI